MGLLPGPLARALLLVLVLTVRAAGAEDPVRGLLRRILPGREDAFVLEAIPRAEGREVFEVAARDGKVVLRGDGPISRAVALNWYLRHVAFLDYGWEAPGPLRPRGALPLPAAPVRRTCRARERFLLNPCTYGYTFPWWGWTSWERFLDWMALQGVNRPLLHAGQEAAWARTWASLGLTRAEILASLPGPAHLPWHRMGNLVAYGGPPPEGWLAGQEVLQRRILARARELGMEAILPAFAGHVPEAFARHHPGARVSAVAPWGGMAPRYHAWFLAPADPLFPEVARRFMEAQAALYGTDHRYAADPFNENPPPSWEPAFLAATARAIYDGMAASDPQAVWYQMAWTFGVDARWTAPRLSALVGAVPPGRLVLLDYAGEDRELYRETGGFFGAPFLWCYLGNFGGDTSLAGPLGELALRAERALRHPGALGLGETLEGLQGNAFAYAFLLERAWSKGFDREAWARTQAACRAGFPDPAVVRAWTLLADRVLVEATGGTLPRGSRLQRAPSLEPGPLPLPYARKDLRAALQALLEAGPRAWRADGVRHDAVDLLRQVLADHTDVLHGRLVAAWRAGDPAAFRRAAARFLAVGKDLDSLLATRREFLLGPWLAQARAWGRTKDEADRLERDARRLLTTWHDPGSFLSDYAGRQWQGLVGSYYVARWRAFLDRAQGALDARGPFDGAAWNAWRDAFERAWTDRLPGPFPTRPSGDPQARVRGLLAKHLPDLVRADAPEVPGRPD